MARSPNAAKQFAEEVERTIESIIGSPEQHARLDGRHRFAIVRRYPYSIVYRIQQDQITIVAVAHASRSPDYWKHRSGG